MSRWKVRAGLLVLFVAGVVTGAGMTIIILQRTLPGWGVQGPTEGRAKIVRLLSWKLRLNEGQKQKAARMVAELQRESYAIRLQHRDEISKTIDRLIREFVPELDDSQRVEIEGLRQTIVSKMASWPDWLRETENYLSQSDGKHEERLNAE